MGREGSFGKSASNLGNTNNLNVVVQAWLLPTTADTHPVGRLRDGLRWRETTPKPSGPQVMVIECEHDHHVASSPNRPRDREMLYRSLLPLICRPPPILQLVLWK